MRLLSHFETAWGDSKSKRGLKRGFFRHFSFGTATALWDTRFAVGIFLERESFFRTSSAASLSKPFRGMRHLVGAVGKFFKYPCERNSG